MILRPVVGVLLVVLVACSQGGGGDSTASTVATTTTATTSTTATNPTDAGEAAVDQLIDDIAEGYDHFRTGSDDAVTMMLGWASASGTYERIAEELRTEPPDDLPGHVVDDLAAALSEAADALMSAGQCAARALETGVGPEGCTEAFSEATSANAMIAVRLEPVIGYGSRPYDEVLALFSS